jgi:hypothetical protein
MVGQMAEHFNPPRECRRELSVDEKAQSCAPEDGVIVLAGGEFEYRGYIFGFEIGIVGEDLFPRRPGGQEIEHVLHTNAKATNGRAATADIRIHRDSVYSAHSLTPGRVARIGPL